MRSGADYRKAIRDGRAVFLDGERLDDASTHATFAEPVRRIAETYDRARSPEVRDATTFVDPDTGQRHSNMWLVPRASADLVARRRTHRLWAEASYGLMGRTPDHVACVLTAFASWRQLFDRGGARFGDNVVRFHARARDEDLYLAYGIVPLQIDRGRSGRLAVHLVHHAAGRGGRALRGVLRHAGGGAGHPDLPAAPVRPGRL